MAELASGAVSSLLGVIRNEAQLLSGVKGDVQFIKGEMESMNSFLMYLARTAPPGGEHDEQVLTWMNQVWQLAQDCNNCIDLYLYYGNPDIHLAKGGVLSYLLWVRWFLNKMVAQHNAAIKLHKLKERERDVGERRLRYGVEVPSKVAAGKLSIGAAEATTPSLFSSALAATSSSAGAGAAEDDDEEEDDHLVVATASNHYSGRRAFIQPRTVEDYVKAKLVDWTREIPASANETLSIVNVAPDTYRDHVLALASEILVFSSDNFGGFFGYHRVVQIDIPAVHHSFQPLRAKDVLYYILRELQHSQSQPQEEQGQGADDDLDSWQV